MNFGSISHSEDDDSIKDDMAFSSFLELMKWLHKIPAERIHRLKEQIHREKKQMRDHVDESITKMDQKFNINNQVIDD